MIPHGLSDVIIMVLCLLGGMWIGGELTMAACTRRHRQHVLLVEKLRHELYMAQLRSYK